MRAKLPTRLWYILTIVAIFAVWHIGGLVWGRQFKLYYLIVLVLSSAFMSLLIYTRKRRLLRDLMAMSPSERDEFLRDAPEVAESINETRPRWYWRLLDSTLALVFAFGPPVCLQFLTGQPMTLDAQVTGWHLLAMFTGFAVYWVGRTLILRFMRKPD